MRGEVSVDLRTDEPDRRYATGAVVRAVPGNRRLTVAGTRPHGARLLVAFTGVSDRGAAGSLRGCALVVDVAPGDRPDDPDEFYDHQLVGLEVRTTSGRTVGTVREVDHLPQQDLLVVDATGRTAPVLVPLVAALVPEVDLEKGVVLVEDPPGLLDDVAATVEG